MSEPVFIEFAEVEILHRMSIERFGGSHGVRDPGAALAAVDQPKNTYFYGQGDLFDIAAAYAFHIAQAQAFLDGNKRTAMAACLVFLERNGVIIACPWEALYDAMIAIAERRLDKSGLAKLLRGA